MTSIKQATLKTKEEPTFVSQLAGPAAFVAGGFLAIAGFDPLASVERDRTHALEAPPPPIVEKAAPRTFSQEQLQIFTGFLSEELRKLPSSLELGNRIQSGDIRVVFKELNWDESWGKSENRLVMGSHEPDSTIVFNSEVVARLLDLAEKKYGGGTAQAFSHAAFLLLPSAVHETSHSDLGEDLRQLLGCYFPCISKEDEFIAFSAEGNFVINDWRAAVYERGLLGYADEYERRIINSSLHIAEVIERSGPAGLEAQITRSYDGLANVGMTEDPQIYKQHMEALVQSYLDRADEFNALVAGTNEKIDAGTLADYRVALNVLADPIQYGIVLNFYREAVGTLRAIGQLINVRSFLRETL